MTARCEECGAPLETGRSCRDYFHEMLAREWEVPGGPGHVGHLLAVTSYNLQHPSKFTAPMLRELRATLADIRAGRATVEDARQRTRAAVDGPTRAVRRPGDPDSVAEGWPSRWPMTIRDVVGVPVSRYLEQVHAWAAAVDSSLP